MSVTVDVAVAGVRLGMPRALAVSAARSVLRAEHVHRATLSVAFVDDRRIAALNHTHLGHRGVTDVISFPFQPATSDAVVTGDIYIAPDVARRAARARRIPLREELVRLVVHGTLHVLGYDHPDDASRLQSAMWKRQERLVALVLRSAGA